MAAARYLGMPVTSLTAHERGGLRISMLVNGARPSEQHHFGDPSTGQRLLFREVFGHEVSQAHWQWKYGGPPGACSFQGIALDDHGPERPWGHVGCLVVPGQWQSSQVHLAHLTDVMVHPTHRGGLGAQGVYPRLMRSLAQALHAWAGQSPGLPLLAYGFPGQTPSRLGERMGLYRPLGPLTSYRTEWNGQSTPSRWACRVAEQPWDKDWLNAIWHRLAPSRPSPSVRKDAAYLTWRYQNHPSSAYRLWRVSGGWWSPPGWVITKSAPEPVIVDTLLPTRHSTPEGWGSVMAALSAVSGVSQWVTWLPPQAHGIRVQAETSLIAPGEFRAAELAGGTLSPWTVRDETPCTTAASAHGARPAAGPNGLFQPGDTDVF